VNSLQLHRQLVQHLTTIGVHATQPQRVNLAFLCQALAVSPNCHLATLALGLPLPGQREHLIQHLRRFLKNDHVHPVDCYGPVVRHVFAHWSGSEVSLVMDRTDLEDRWSVLTLGAAYQKRLVPLAWDVLSFGGTSADRQIGLLKRVRPYLPAPEQVRVNFYGDCEFRAVPLQQTCKDFGWHWQVGLKSDVYFQSPDGVWQALRDLNVQPGQRRYLQGVALTQEHTFGPVNLMADWSPNQDSPRYWALDQTANVQAWRRGRKRYWIEPTFRDWKSYGFDLEKSKLDDAERLNSLLLGMALTTVWMIHIGDWLIHQGRRQELAPLDKADYSLFRLGRDYVQRCRTLGQSVPVGFTVRHTA
jgi:hypothetical protein